MVEPSTPEELARLIQEGVELDSTELSKKISYMIGNATLRSLNIKEEFAQNVIGCGGTLQGCYSMGTTVWKTVEDISRGDKLCTGLCIVSTACEGVAITASLCKFIPFRLRIYTVSKGTSLGLMRFRNLCRKANGQIGPC
jgi:hypothetical protein